MSNDTLDFSGGLNHNNNQNVNDAPDEVIRMDEVEPLFDADCKHTFKKDDDKIGDYQAWVCTKCHRGTFLPDGVQII